MPARVKYKFEDLDPPKQVETLIRSAKILAAQVIRLKEYSYLSESEKEDLAEARDKEAMAKSKLTHAKSIAAEWNKKHRNDWISCPEYDKLLKRPNQAKRRVQPANMLVLPAGVSMVKALNNPKGIVRWYFYRGDPNDGEYLGDLVRKDNPMGLAGYVWQSQPVFSAHRQLYSTTHTTSKAAIEALTRL